jgi:LysM repeat protein
MPRLSVLIPILLILLIVAIGVYWIYTGASRTAGTAVATTPGAGTTPVQAAGAGTTPTPTRQPASATGTTPVPTPAGEDGDVQLASNEILYQVRQGDTLWAIARTYNTTVDAIVKRNNIPNPNLIYVGQRLIVPKGVVPTPTPTGQVVYFVEWGDTLWDIARRYGTTVDAIAAVNNIPDPDCIYVGQRLVIPQPAVG